MRISKASEARKLLKRDCPLYDTRFDMGKYKGVPSDYVGKEVQDIDGVICVYAVQRKGADGKYVALKCVSERV